MINKEVVLKQQSNKYSGETKVLENFIQIESAICSISKEGEFYFNILQEMRKELEKIGITLLLNGSRRDVFPSTMTLPSYKAYIHVIGRRTGIDDLVNIFDDFTDLSILSTVEEQNLYHELWVKSISMK